MLITILHMQKYQKLKELLHKAISVELRTSIKNMLFFAVDWGDSNKVACYSHDPDFFIAVLRELEGTKKSLLSRMETIRRQLHVQIRTL